MSATLVLASVFGGDKEPQSSAYDGHLIDDKELSVALPFRFIRPYPKVKVTNCSNGKSVVCSVSDIGPWNIDDPYWAQPGRRPQAEKGTDSRGRKTNKAGIDLSPAAARAIDLPGMGKVNWQFV